MVTGPGGFNSNVSFNPYSQKAQKTAPLKSAAPPASVFGASNGFDSVSFGSQKHSVSQVAQPTLPHNYTQNLTARLSQMDPHQAADQFNVSPQTLLGLQAFF